MSGDQKDPRFGSGPPRPDQPESPRQPEPEQPGQRPDEPRTQSGRQPGAAPGSPRPADRPADRPVERPPAADFQSRSGFRPAQPPRPPQGPGYPPSGNTTSVPAARPAAPPWDLTTRVPAAGARHANPEDLALFAMQLLSPEESAAIAQHVQHCVECRRELAQIRGDLGAYAFTVDMHEPSTAARDRLFKQVAREKKAIPISHSRSAANIATFGRTNSILVPDVEDTPAYSRTPVYLAWAGWAAAAALAITTGVVYRNYQGLRSSLAGQAAQYARLQTDAAQARRVMEAVTDPHAQRVTLTTKPLPPSPIGRATYNPDKGALVFLASDMDPLQPDKTYELWLIPADGSNPLPAGTFHPDDQGNASVIMPALPKGVQAKGFGVTVEDEGGSQTPTKPIIMSGF
jgi:hypothetical protein